MRKIITRNLCRFRQRPPAGDWHHMPQRTTNPTRTDGAASPDNPGTPPPASGLSVTAPGMRLQSVALAEALVRARPGWTVDEYTITRIPSSGRCRGPRRCCRDCRFMARRMRHRPVATPPRPPPPCRPVSRYPDHLRAADGRICAGDAAACPRGSDIHAECSSSGSALSPTCSTRCWCAP